MSSVDERIVRMTFDNAGFSNKINSTINAITQLNKATDKVAENTAGISAMGKAFQQAELMSTQAGLHIKDVWLKVTNILEYQVANKIVNIGKKIANALTMEGVSDGFREYELKMGSIQTIMAGTGESLATVNRYLEELNTYSDKTIYSFADMTNNIGKFTNAGVKLNDAVAAIKGIANEAAISGANANEASRAMYNFSQALSAGYVKLIDWKSIENANMATKGFKETLLDMAVAMGNVQKAENGMYKVLTKSAQGGVMQNAISATKNFNDSLSYQWMTTDVLTKTLKVYATDVRSLTQDELDAYEAELKALGMTEEQIKHFEEIGKKATDAASEIKTFTMLIDTLKEAIGSGWAMTWQTIIGDFEQAKSLWTEVGSVLSEAIDNMSTARNEMLSGGLQTGWEKFITIDNRAIPASEKFRDLLLDTGVAYKKISYEQAKEIESTEDLVKSFHELGWVTGDILTKSVEDYYKAMSELTDEQLEANGLSKADVASMRKLSIELKTGARNADEFARSMKELGGREILIEALRDVFNGLLSVATPVSEAFRNIFPQKTADDVFKLTKAIKDFTSKLTITDKTAEKLRQVFTGVFATVDIGIKIVKSFINAISPVKTDVSSLAEYLLDSAANLGMFIKRVDDAITKTGLFDAVFKTIGDTIYKPINFIKEHANDILNFITSIFSTTWSLTSGFAKVIGAVYNFFKALVSGFKKAFGSTKSFDELFTSAITSITDKLEKATKAIDSFTPSIEGVVEIFERIGKGIGDSLRKLNEALGTDNTGANFLQLFIGILNAALTGGILKCMYNFTDALDALGDALEAFTLRVASDALVNIGKAMLMLAGALFVVAAIDEGKLSNAIGAFTAMMTMLTVAMVVFLKAINVFSSSNMQKVSSLFGKELFGMFSTGFDIKKMLTLSASLAAFSKILISIGASVLLLAVGLKVISSAAEGGHLWDSLVALGLIVAGLTTVGIIISKFAGDKVIKGVLSLSVAVLLISKALTMIAEMVAINMDSVLVGTGMIVAILTVLMGVVLMLQNFGQFQMGGLLGLISMAAALYIVVKALVIVTDEVMNNGYGIVAAMTVIIAILAALTAVSVVLSMFAPLAAVGALGAILVAASLLVFVVALKQISDLLGKTDNHAWEALGLIAVVLVELAVGLTLMIAAIPGAIALTVASVGLIALAAALKIMATIPLTSLVKSILGLFGALIVLGAGLTFMIIAKPGAKALDIASEALIKLGAALAILGGLNVWHVINGLIALAIAIVGLSVVSIIATLASPALLIFSAVLIPLSAALGIAGLALGVFSAGLESLILVIPVIVTVIVESIKTIIEFIEWFIVEIDDFGKEFENSGKNLVQGLIDGILNNTAVGKAVGAAAKLGKMIIDGLNSKEGLDEHSPSHKSFLSGAGVPSGFIGGLNSNSGLATLAAKLFGFDITTNLDEGLDEGSTDVLDTASLLGTGITDNISESIDLGSMDVMSSIDELGIDMSDGLGNILDDGNGGGLKDIFAQFGFELGKTSENVEDLDEATNQLNASLRYMSPSILQTIENCKKLGKNYDLLNAKARYMSPSILQQIEDSKKLGKNYKENTKTLFDFDEVLSKVTADMDTNSAATSKSSGYTRKYGDVMEYASGAVKAFYENYKDAYGEIGDIEKWEAANNAIRRLAEETYNASLKMNKAVSTSKSSKEALDDLVQSFIDMREGLISKVQSVFSGESFFQNFEVNMDKTMGDIINGMQSNVNAVEMWANDLTLLGNRGISQGLLKYLAELGPKSYAYVHAFATSTNDELTKANQLFTKASEMEGNVADRIVASYARAGVNAVLGLTNALQDNADLAEQAGADVGNAAVEGVLSKEGLDEHSPSKKTKKAGEYAVLGLKNGIESLQGLVAATAQKLGLLVVYRITDSLNRNTFFKVGQEIVMSLAEGIASNDAISSISNSSFIISQAIQDATELAVDNMEIEPVISPVLDLSGVKKAANIVGGLFPKQSISMASTVGANAKSYNQESSSSAQNGPNQINFTQNNYSPKALSTIDIYRQTNNQVSVFKRMVTS